MWELPLVWCDGKPVWLQPDELYESKFVDVPSGVLLRVRRHERDAACVQSVDRAQDSARLGRDNVGGHHNRTLRGHFGAGTDRLFKLFARKIGFGRSQDID